MALISVLIVTAFTSTAPSAARGDLLGKTGAITSQDWQNKVDASVLSKASAGPTEFLIYMAKQADLSGAEALSTKEEKGAYVYRQLTTIAAETQPAVKQTLQGFNSEFRSFWVTNVIWAGAAGTIQAIPATEVAYVLRRGRVFRIPPQKRLN